MNKRIYAMAAVVAVLLAVFVVMGSGYAEKNFAVAYINSAQITAQHPEMVKTTKELEQKTQVMQQELETKAKTLNKEDQQKLLSEYQTKLDTERQTKLNDAAKRVNAQIKSFAKKLGYTLVLDSRSVIYGGTDITDDVIKAAKANSK